MTLPEACADIDRADHLIATLRLSSELTCNEDSGKRIQRGFSEDSGFRIQSTLQGAFRIQDSGFSPVNREL